MVLGCKKSNNKSIGQDSSLIGLYLCYNIGVLILKYTKQQKINEIIFFRMGFGVL